MSFSEMMTEDEHFICLIGKITIDILLYCTLPLPPWEQTMKLEVWEPLDYRDSQSFVT